MQLKYLDYKERFWPNC